MTDALAAMPKAELHVHLEGTISADTLWVMAARNEVALPAGSLGELRALYRFESFDTFLSLWMAMCRCLKREADLSRRRARRRDRGPGARAGGRAGAEGPARAARGRAVEDEATLRLLAAREVCCDVALTSNTFLTVYRELSAHPLRRMIAAGVPVTLSTDDPPFFDTDLVAEYRRARDEMGFSEGELWQLNLNGLRYGLADVGLRRRLLREFEEAGRGLGLWVLGPGG